MNTSVRKPTSIDGLRMSLQVHALMGSGACFSIVAISFIAGAMTTAGYDTVAKVVAALALIPCLAAIWVVGRLRRLWDEMTNLLDARDADDTRAGEPSGADLPQRTSGDGAPR